MAAEKRLDILVLNAGIMATPAGLTEQGYEAQFGTNHVGHALLTKLLLPTLLSTAEEPGADVRVVSLSSMGHTFSPPRRGIDFANLKSDMAGSLTFMRYGQSKLANILFAKEMARRYPVITTVAVHPGVVNTELYRNTQEWWGVGYLVGAMREWMWTSVQEGAKGQLWAATAPLAKTDKGAAGNGVGVESGEYYCPVGVTGKGSKWSCDTELAGRLWEWTEKELESYTL